MEMNNFLDIELQKAKNVFAHSNLYKHIKISNFNCKYLPDKKTDGRNLPKILLEKFFYQLHSEDHQVLINERPCLYVFELVNFSDRERVWKTFNELKNTQIDRTLPATVKNLKENTKILYVGKAERNVGGRIVTHMGYYQKKMNHGLQLAFWARKLEILINVHVFRFEPDMKPYLDSFEKLLAKELQPIIGLHK